MLRRLSNNTKHQTSKQVSPGRDTKQASVRPLYKSSTHPTNYINDTLLTYDFPPIPHNL